MPLPFTDTIVRLDVGSSTSESFARMSPEWTVVPESSLSVPVSAIAIGALSVMVQLNVVGVIAPFESATSMVTVNGP